MFQAFIHGKAGIDQLLLSLIEVAAQFVFMEGLKYVLSGGLAGIFGLENGGIVGKAANGYVIPGTSYSGDQIPIMANSGEMVLNTSQQMNMLKLLSAPTNSYNQMMMGKMDTMNMNMQSQQPTILIHSTIPGQKFTKEIVNPSQAKLIKGNIINVT